VFVQYLLWCLACLDSDLSLKLYLQLLISNSLLCLPFQIC
jgi:hypothetical protein